MTLNILSCTYWENNPALAGCWSFQPEEDLFDNSFKNCSQIYFFSPESLCYQEGEKVNSTSLCNDVARHRPPLGMTDGNKPNANICSQMISKCLQVIDTLAETGIWEWGTNEKKKKKGLNSLASIFMTNNWVYSHVPLQSEVKMQPYPKSALV